MNHTHATRARRQPHAEGWCQTCGNPVTLENKCGCWSRAADALQQFLGMDFDTSAQMAADLWNETPDEDKERVWTAAYADYHDGVATCPPPPALAALQEQDARAFPHDDPCPRCGRRQWTDERNRETCQACGWTLSGAA